MALPPSQPQLQQRQQQLERKTQWQQQELKGKEQCEQKFSDLARVCFPFNVNCISFPISHFPFSPLATLSRSSVAFLACWQLFCF